MRILFLLLLLLNLGFFAYHHFLLEADPAPAQIAALQLNPEKIRSVTAAPASAAATAQPPSAAAGAPVCMSWGVFSGPDVTRADEAVAALGLPANAVIRQVESGDGYWIHLPVQKSRADVERKAGELKALGITDYVVVTEPERWRNAISLGLFKSQAPAEAQLDKLREQGVKTALVTRRERLLKQVIFYVREPDTALVARLAAAQKAFPASEMKAGACPVER